MAVVIKNEKGLIENDPRVFYFAHTVNTYNTPIEKAVMLLLQNHFPGIIVENPNQPHHQMGYQKYAKRIKERDANHRGMNYFFDEVLPQCDGCIAMPFLDGRIGLGVAGEVKWFVSRNRPVWVMQPIKNPISENLSRFIENPLGGFSFVRLFTHKESTLLLAEDPRLVVPHEETRLGTWQIYNLVLRSYERAHLVTMPIPPEFYPEK